MRFDFFASEDVEVPDHALNSVKQSGQVTACDNQDIAKWLSSAELMERAYSEIEAQSVECIEDDCVPNLRRRTYRDAIAALQRDKRRCVPDSVITQEPGGTDIVVGEYEGGLKTWECSVDLARFIIEEVLTNEVSSEGKQWPCRVLELGCGSALPSLAVRMVRPDAHITLQDYNAFVLEHVTAVNLALNGTPYPLPDPEANAASESLTGQTEFISGSWGSMSESAEFASVQPYDLILTSETIYNPCTASDLLDVIEAALEPKRGVALIAAKSVYFGVGGTVADFINMVHERGRHNASVVWEQKDGGVCRVIVRLVALGRL